MTTPLPSPVRRAPVRRAVLVGSLVAALVAVAVAVGAFVVPGLQQGGAAEQPAGQPVSTAPVTAGDMVEEIRMPGTIAYAETVPITAGLAGVLTELPAPGSTAGRGGVLYRVDTRPVVLLAGGLPAWRDFTPGMTNGDDVVQLEENLVADGFLDEAADARFDADTAVAVRGWQRSLGLEPTGTIERTTVVFRAGELRVDSVEARLGQEVAPGTVLYQAITPEKVVDLAVTSSNRGSTVTGSIVRVELPDGSSVEGIIRSVSAPRSRPDADGSGTSVIVPVRIGVADQAAIADLALASVTVSIAGTVRHDVLTVPIDALVPLDDTRYAVEIDVPAEGGRRTLLPVTVGAASSGRVEIAGDGIVEGLLVVVPTR